MYRYLNDDEKEFINGTARPWSSNFFEQVKISLRKKNINTEFILVGSGGKNIITRNGNGPIDLDYNINILSAPDFDPKITRDNVESSINEVLKKYKLNNCKNSTSSFKITSLHFKDIDFYFSIDVAVICKNNIWYKNILDKTNGFNNAIWNECPNSNGYQNKAKIIKKHSSNWMMVREEYLKLKNVYLDKGDEYHPSFVCYIEAVNNVYNTLKKANLI